MSYEHMNTVTYLVTLRLPDEIPPEQGLKELRTCVTFGQAGISLLYVLPDGCDEQCCAAETNPKPFGGPETLLPGISP